MGALAVDSSAMLAIMFFEPDAQRFIDGLASAEHAYLSSASYLESAIVFDRRPSLTARKDELDDLIRMFNIQVVPFTGDHAALARTAYRTYGKGKHKAALNMGDCFAYALAKSRKIPLLYKGNDFDLTDVKKL